MGQDIRERSARLLAIAAVAVTLISVASTGAIGALGGSGPTALGPGADEVKSVGSADVAGPGAQERIGTYGVFAQTVQPDTYVSEFKDGDGKPAETSENQSIPPFGTVVGDVTGNKFNQMQSATDGDAVTAVAEAGDDLAVGFAIRSVPDGYNQSVQLRHKNKGTGGETPEDMTGQVVAENGTVFSNFTIPYTTTFNLVTHYLGDSARNYANQHGSVYVVVTDATGTDGDDLTVEFEYLRVHTLSDDTPPSISNGLLVDDTDGDGNVTDGDTISVYADVSDGESGVASVTTDASVFGGPASLELFDNDSDGTYNATFTAETGGTDGTHSLTITATDNATTPNTNTTTTNSLTLDTTPPSVTNPTLTDLFDGNGTVGANHDVLVEAKVTDTTLKNVTADTTGFGGPPALNLTDPDGDDVFNATITVDGPNATEGPRTVTITAFDWLNQSTQNTTNALTVDTTDPTISNANLVDNVNGDGTVNDGDEVIVNATVNGTGSNASVTTDASVFGGPVSLTLTDPDGDEVFNNTFNVNISTATGTDGNSYDLTVNVSDEAGNQNSTTTNTLVLSTEDTTAPSVTNATLVDDTDGNGVVGDGDELSVTADVDDNQNVGNVTVDASVFGASSSIDLFDNDSDGTYNATVIVEAPNASADGPYSLNVTADDGSGNVGWNQTGNVTLDTTAPDVTNATLTEGSGDGVVGDGDSLTVSADVSDATNVTVTADASDFGAGTVNLNLTTGTTYEATFQVNATNAAADGNYSIVVNATDEEANVGNDSTGELTLDTTPPTASNANLVEETAPIDGNVSDGDTVRVNVTATDTRSSLNVTTNASVFGGPASLQLTGPDANDVFNATFTVDAANATGVPGSSYNLTVNVTDEGGNVNATTTNTLTLTEDTTPPSVTNATLVDATDGNGVVNATHQLTVSADVSDDSAIKNVTANASDFGNSSVTLTKSSGTTYTATFTVDAANASSDGSYNVTVTAFDTAENQASNTTGKVTLDTSVPTLTEVNLVEVTAPVDGNLTDGDEVLVNATVTDLTALNVTTDASVFGGPSVLNLTDTDNDGVFNATFTVDTGNATGTDGGSYNLTVEATDQALNENATATNSLTLQFDTTAPTVTNATLTDAAGDGVVGDGDQVTVGANVTDTGTIANVTANASVFGNDSVPLSLVSGDRFEGTFTVDAGNASADGSYNVTVTAFDDEGNDASNTTTNLTLDTTQPVVTDATLTDLENDDDVVGDGHQVEIGANVTDATNVTVTADASAFGVGTVTLNDTDADGRYTHTFTASSGGTNGSHALTVSATDDGDNTGTNTTESMTLDLVAPSISDANLVEVTGSVDGNVTDGDTVEINATVTDATTLNVTTNASVFGGPASLNLTDPDGDDVFNATFTVDAANATGTNGNDYALTANATDAGDNWNTTTTNALTLDFDTNPPIVTNATLVDATDGNGVVNATHQLTVSADVTDDTSIKNVTADASAFGAGTVELASASGDTYNVTFTVDAGNASADGSYNLTVTAFDDVGNSASNTTGNVTLDTTAPSVTNANLVEVTGPVDGTVVDGDEVLVNATVTDLTSVNVTTNASVFGGPSNLNLTDPDGDNVFNATFTVNTSTATGSDGTDYALTVNATDQALNENSSTTNTLTLNPDTTAPTVTNATLTESASDGVVGDGDRVTVGADVVDSGTIANVTANASVFGNESVELSPVSGDRYEGEFTVVAANASGDGSYNLTVNATDASGNWATNTTGNLTLDTTAPTVTNATLTDLEDDDGVVGDGDQVEIAANVSDATNVTVTADASAFGAGTVTLGDGDGDGRYTQTFTANTGGTDDTHNLTVSVTDAGDNTGSNTTNALTLDTAAPSVTNANLVEVTAPIDGTVLDGDTVLVNATVTDATSLNVTTNASVFGGPSSLELFDNDTDGTYNATFTVNTTTAWGDDGTAYSLTVNATDAASNSNETDTNKLTLNPDSTAPSVTDATLTEAAGDGVVGDGDVVTVGANVTDAGGVSSVTANASVFGNGSVTLSVVSDDRYEGTFTIDDASAAADGSYNLTVNATDTSGNWATNTTGNLTLDTTQPSVSDANLVDDDGDGNVSDGDSVVVNVTATDATELNVTADASEFGAGTVVLSDPDGDNVFNATFTVNESAAAADGNYDLQVTATDAGDNANTAVTNELTLERATADIGPPTVTNATLTDDTDGNGVVGDDDTFVVEANVTDDTSVSSVTADASDFGAGTLTLSLVSEDLYRATGTVDDASAAADDDHDVTITATDGAGNTTTVTTGTLTLDTTAPTVSNANLVDVTDGDGTVEDGDTILVNVTATDSTGLTVTADASDFGAGTVTLTDPDGDEVFNETFTVDTASASADGSYSLTVTATDDGGNAGTATTNSLTIDRPSQPPAGGGGGGGGGNGGARTSVSVSPRADGSYSVLVTDTRGGRPVRVRLPAAADGRIDLDVLEFTTTRRLSMSLTTRSSVEAPAESGPYPDDEARRAVGYLSIDHPDTPNDQIGPSTIRFSVRRSVLEAEDVEPDQITLYRFSDGEWTELPTRVDAQNPERVFYLADSPGLSVFAVGVGYPVLSLGDASLSTARLETGQTLEVAATVENRGAYRGSFKATLSVAGVSTDERTVSVEPGESVTVDLRHVFAEPGEYSVRLNDRDLGTVVVVDVPTSTPGTPTPGETPTPGTPDDRTPIDLEDPRASLGWLGDVGLVLVLYLAATIAVILGVRRFQR